MWIKRKFDEKIISMCMSRPAVLLTGARQVGKSSLLQNIDLDLDYITFDKETNIKLVKENSSSFLKSFKKAVVFDEVQYIPELFKELKYFIDNDRQNYGKWILTGSQKFQLIKKVQESLAGRIGISHLETLSIKEIVDSNYFDEEEVKKYLWKGGYPELWSNSLLNSNDFFEDYIKSYLERDVKDFVLPKNTRDFVKFIYLCAANIGQLLNYTTYSKAIGVSVPTIKEWINILDASGIIYLLTPYFANNFSKRLVKAPKLYFADHGFLCSLLNINNRKDFFRNKLMGNIWENLVFCELMKTYRLKLGRNFFFYRDQNGVEVDFLIVKSGEISLIEAKAAEKILDDRKLNFNKVVPLFAKEHEVEATVACMIDEKRTLRFKDYNMVNPMLSEMEF